jgi:hypothetical protein
MMWNIIVHTAKLLHMRFVWCLTKATDTHLDCMIIIAFLLQQWLDEGASVLRYTYIACTDSVAWCVGSGLCDKLITRLEEF